jgi:hypothetical protein
MARSDTEAADDLLRVLNGPGPEKAGGFHADSGQELPW